MNANPYSCDQCLNILALCVSIEKGPGTILVDTSTLGRNLIEKITEMNRLERLELMKEVIEYL
jgi:hypothetical protein